MQGKDWFKQAKMYHILIDRFNGNLSMKNDNNFLGGNIRGIIEKLDYIINLGFNTIWLSPFYKTDEYHGYHITDFMEVDEHFGTIEDLNELIQKAHNLGLKVIVDFVPNHCSIHHPFFKHAQKYSDSKYKNWFVFDIWPQEYSCFLNYKQLPKINLENLEARNYMLSVAEYWLSLGIDGFRIDHVIGPSHKFWQFFNSSIRVKFPYTILFGEAWAEGLQNDVYNTISFKHKFIRKLFGVSQEKLQLEYKHVFNGILDFTCTQLIIKAVLNGESLTNNKKLNSLLQSHFTKYPSNYSTILFLDNHDMNRFLFYTKGDLSILLEALQLLLSFKQPIAVYYGTEQAMQNSISITPAIPYSDLLVREPFNWNTINVDLNSRIKSILIQE